MDTHEYQAKEILNQYGIPTPPFVVAKNLKEVEDAIDELQLTQAVLKIQVHAGGRGKSGGIKIARNPKEILDYANELIGMRLQNVQTGKDGILAQKIIVTPLVDIDKEYYVSIIIDRKKGTPLLILSTEGGMDIEEVAAKKPEKILTIPLGIQGQIKNYHWILINKWMNWDKELAEQGKKILTGLAKAFIEKDASLLEINPLVKTKEGKLIALDAKLSIDENALFRHKELKGLEDLTQMPKNEAEAHKYELAYVGLEGDIGCMVNGAGLAMATMDIIHLQGGHPANFLDVGGGATEEKVSQGFTIILADPNVKAILVNIFGGIMNCETIAKGIINAVKKDKISIPIVVRMEGNNVEKGREVLQNSGLDFLVANDLTDAAQKVVSLARGV